MATGHHHHGANPGREGCRYSAVSGTGRQARRRSRADLPAPVSHEGPGRPWVDAPRLARSALGLSIALALAVPSVARANPQGGQVVAGSVTMTQTAPRRLDVVQSTQSLRKISVFCPSATPTAERAAWRAGGGGGASGSGETRL